jgi:hypothetical protein
MSEKNDKRKELASLLADIWEEYEFIFGTLNVIQEGKQTDELLEYLKSNDSLTSDEVIEKTLLIREKYDPDFGTNEKYW